MRHCSPAALERMVAALLLDEADMTELLRCELLRAGHDKKVLARRLGITEWRLSCILRGVHPLPPSVAEKLGYRRVTRFEKIA